LVVRSNITLRCVQTSTLRRHFRPCTRLLFIREFWRVFFNHLQITMTLSHLAASSKVVYRILTWKIQKTTMVGRMFRPKHHLQPVVDEAPAAEMKFQLCQDSWMTFSAFGSVQNGWQTPSTKNQEATLGHSCCLLCALSKNKWQQFIQILHHGEQTGITAKETDTLEMRAEARNNCAFFENKVDYFQPLLPTVHNQMYTAHFYTLINVSYICEFYYTHAISVFKPSQALVIWRFRRVYENPDVLFPIQAPFRSANLN